MGTAGPVGIFSILALAAWVSLSSAVMRIPLTTALASGDKRDIGLIIGVVRFGVKR